MSNLIDWAIRWGVPFVAVQDLKMMLGSDQPTVIKLVDESDVMCEATVQNIVRMEGKHYGVTMWRNNVGALKDDKGRFVRFGLCNDSKQLNEMIKSGDLIGIKPILITHQHVGHTIGQFVSRECKPSDWTYTGTPRETAQLRWAEIITSLGGDASFVNNKGSFK